MAYEREGEDTHETSIDVKDKYKHFFRFFRVPCCNPVTSYYSITFNCIVIRLHSAQFD